MQGGRAPPLDLSTAAPGPDPGRSRRCLRAWLRAYAIKHPATGSGALGRRCASTSVVRSTRRRCTACGVRKGCRCGCTARATGWGVLDPADRRRRPESGVGDRFPVRLHDRWQGDQDRVDDRRAHPRLAAALGRAFDHRRTSCDRVEEGVRCRCRTAEGAADGQWAGIGFSSAATVLRRKGRDVLHPARTPWDNGYIESFNNRLRKECLNRNHWNSLFEARVVIGDFKQEHNWPDPLN